MQTEGELETFIQSHASEMSERFSARAQDANCAACGISASTKCIKLHWRAVYGNARTALVTILALLQHTAYMKADFWTHHCFCGPCYRRVVWRRTLAELARYVSFVMVLLSGGTLAASLVFLIVVVLDFDWKLFGYLTFGFVCGCAGLMVAIWSTMKLDQWCVPLNLRGIAKRPFQLYQVHLEKK